MILNHIIILLFLYCVTNTWADTQVDLESNDLNEVNSGMKLLDNNDVNEINKLPELVHLQLYYEVLDHPAMIFYLFDFEPVVRDMINDLFIDTYPFGNAEIIIHNDTVEFKCPHGPDECYGNKLHACANFYIYDNFAVLFNNCVMRSGTNIASYDDAADRCGEEMNFDSDRIKACAKGTLGTELLISCGEESKKAKLPFIPYILVNGKMYDMKTDIPFKEFVCAAFTKKPLACENV